MERKENYCQSLIISLQSINNDLREKKRKNGLSVDDVAFASGGMYALLENLQITNVHEENISQVMKGIITAQQDFQQLLGNIEDFQEYLNLIGQNTSLNCRYLDVNHEQTGKRRFFFYTLIDSLDMVIVEMKKHKAYGSLNNNLAFHAGAIITLLNHYGITLYPAFKSVKTKIVNRMTEIKSIMSQGDDYDKYYLPIYEAEERALATFQ